jgi:hypothetical protein
MARSIVRSIDVYRWPEWKAFAKRLGIAEELSTVSLTIELCVGDTVVVTQKYIPKVEVEQL